MRKSTFIVLAVLLNACSMSNSRLISYDSENLGEDGKFYDQISNEIVPKYETGKIYINEIVALNSCGEYDGDIEIVNDSIYLIQDNSSFILCASRKFAKVKYVIDNPENKKYKFSFKYE